MKKTLKAITLGTGIALTGSALAMSSSSGKSDPITDFGNSWAGKALTFQSKLDDHTPMSTNNIIGTHNSYNSSVYRDVDSYIDPQQKHSIYDQLRMGARFVELDAHWTYKIDGFDWGNDLLLCHSGIGKNFGDVHVGCSLTDRYLSEGLQEIRNWLDANPAEVIILYIEDHTDGHHAELRDRLNSKLGGKIYASNGCKDVPSTLTENQVRAAGKQVILWKDSGCSSDSGLKNMAFTGLGSINRTWEDRTNIGALGGFFTGNAVKRIEANDVREGFKNGSNIINLDDMTYNDGRLEAAIWSWDKNEPNNHGGNQDCAVQWGNGRWDDANCGNSHHFACKDDNGNWALSNYAAAWTEGNQACSQLAGNYTFAAPSSSPDNEALKTAKAGVTHVWVNMSDRDQEGEWKTPFSAETPVYKELKDRRANKCLDVDGGKNDNGRNVQLYSCNGSNAQKWFHDRVTGQIKNVMGKCLDIPGNDNGVKNGANVQIWDCHAGAVDQTWDRDGELFRNRKNTNMVIDAFGDDNRDNVGLWSHHGGNNQRWR